MNRHAEYFSPRGVWPTFVIMASGPSMCQEDADLVQDRWMTDGLEVIVVNSTFRLAPWADYLYTNDHDWLEWHLPEIGTKSPHIAAICGHEAYARDGVVDYIPFDKEAKGLYPKPGHISWGMNSGGAAISLAERMGASKIILLGYDQQWDGDRPRWHGKHPPHLQNRKPGFHRWAEWFKQAAKDAEELGVDIVNCSRQTSLECFRRARLEDEL